MVTVVQYRFCVMSFLVTIFILYFQLRYFFAERLLTIVRSVLGLVNLGF